MEHLRYLHKKLSGRVLPGRDEFLHMRESYNDLFRIIQRSVEQHESVLCFLMGPLQSGKYTLLRKVIWDVKYHYSCSIRFIILKPENCFSLPSAVACLHEQIFPEKLTDTTDHYSTTTCKISDIVTYLKGNSHMVSIIYLPRFTYSARLLPNLIYTLLDSIELSRNHSIGFVASDHDVVKVS